MSSDRKRNNAPAEVTPQAKKARLRAPEDGNLSGTPRRASNRPRGGMMDHDTTPSPRNDRGNVNHEKQDTKPSVRKEATRDEEGEILMGFGRHKDLTFSQAHSIDPGYYKHFMKDVPDPDAKQLRFLHWVERQNGEESRSHSPKSTTKEPVNDGDVEFKFGKHKGRTFSEVYYEYPDYEEWAKKQSNPTGQLKEFLGWVVAFNTLVQTRSQGGRSRRKQVASNHGRSDVSRAKKLTP